MFVAWNKDAEGVETAVSMFGMTIVQETAVIVGFVGSGLVLGFAVVVPCATQLALRRGLVAGS